MRAVLALVWLSGCMVLVHVDSRPVAAEVETPDGQRLRLPADVPLRWVPFARPQLLCTGVGYRPVSFRVRLGLGPLLPGAARPVEVVLVPEHGPSGTWSKEDVP